MLLEILLHTLIEAKFEGGQEAFAEKFYLHILEVGSDTKIISAPRYKGEKLPKVIVEGLKDLSAKVPFVLIQAHVSNFDQLESEGEANAAIKEHLGRGIKEFAGNFVVAVSNALIDVRVQNIAMDSEEGDSIIELFTSMDFAPNVCIAFEEGFSLHIQCEPLGEESTTTLETDTLITGRPDRNISINKDDQCNLKIALGQANTVEDFIAMM
jgi:hypothetical protein